MISPPPPKSRPPRSLKEGKGVDQSVAVIALILVILHLLVPRANPLDATVEQESRVERDGQ
jgi:hypothetical protein